MMLQRGWWWVGVLLLISCGEDEPTIPDLSIKTTALAEVYLGNNYDARLEVTGGEPPYTVAVVEGALPSGIELKATTLQLLGVAGTPGRAKFTIEAKDNGGRSARAALELFVIPDALQIITQRLPMGREGDAYAQTVVASGGVPPLVYSLGAGALPAGLNLANTGVLSGTPTVNGSFDLVMVVTDAEKVARTQGYTLVISARDPMITTTAVDQAREGSPYNSILQATGGTPPYSWSETAGALPAGIELGLDGALSGTPTESGSFDFTARVTDAAARTDDVMLTLQVIAPLQLLTSAVPQAIQDRPYSFQFQAAGGAPPYTWSVTGAPPAGISLSAEGLLAGTTTSLGDTELTIRVRDSEGFQKSGLFTLRVSDRYVYEITPTDTFPRTCTATVVSYTTYPIVVPDSFQIADVDVSVESNYPASNQHLRYVLWSPDNIPTVLCGDGIGRGTGLQPTVNGGRLCNGSGGITRSYDDDGANVNEPERPLSAMDGFNAVGTWRLSIGVTRPNCNLNGTVSRVVLSLQDDRATEPYAIVRGFTRHNLLTEPWVRMAGGGVDEHEIFLSATAYDVGPNGRREGGKGDDVARPNPMTWSVVGAPQGLSVTPDGHVTAGPRTGTGQLTASGGGVSVTLPIHVSPPEWHPASRIY